MATATVSASVDSEVKRLAGSYIRAAQTTPNEVIRRLWEHIAATGEVPTYDEAPEGPASDEPEAFQELMRLRAQVATGTPLSTMGPDDLRKELEDRGI